MNTQNDKVLNSARISRGNAMLKFVLTWLFTIAILVIIFSRIKFFDVLMVLKQTDMPLLFVGILLSIGAHVIFSSARYQKIVYALGYRIPFYESVIIRMGCNPIKGVLPFKVGELAILAYMKKKHNLSYPLGLFSLLLGYIYSFIVLVLFYSFGGVFYFHDFSQKIIFTLMFMIILFLIATSNRKKIFRFIKWFALKFQKYPEDLALLREKYDVTAIRNVFPHSMGIEGFKLLIIFVLFKSLHIQIPLDALLFLGSTTIIAAYIPITYWGMGIRESAVLFLFSHYATPDRLLAGSLLVTLVDAILPALLGLLFIKPFLNSLWDDI
jgi:uncharacterized protein (TIRG00374 family)